MDKLLNFLIRWVLALAAIALIGGAGWITYTSADAVPRRGVKIGQAGGGGLVHINVESGDTAATIGKRLESARVIDSAKSFERLVQILGLESDLVAGDYEFLPGTSAIDAIVRIRDGLTAARVVPVPEGLRLEEIAALLDQRGVVKADDFMDAARRISASPSGPATELLSGRPSSASLEGYLFPATYSFSIANEDPNKVVQTMLDAMAERFTPELRREALSSTLTLHEILTLASIIEREATLPEEMPVMASVYLNRLKAGMPLQADPTVQYAISSRGGSVSEFGYWKRSLSVQDLQFDSNYNTYLKPGLPPGPIANPGIGAITAVIRPADTDFLYFVARSDGSHVFAETFEEHQFNVQQSQR